MRRYRDHARREWTKEEDFGMQNTYFRRLIDLQILNEWLMDIWNARVVSFNAGSPLSMEDIWSTWCLAKTWKYFRCRYQIDLTEAFGTIGVYDPAHQRPGTGLPSPQ